LPLRQLAEASVEAPLLPEIQAWQTAWENPRGWGSKRGWGWMGGEFCLVMGQVAGNLTTCFQSEVVGTSLQIPETQRI